MTVPDLRGLSESAAKDKLASANLKVGTVTEEYSDSVTKGNVLSQSYSPGTEIGEDSTVNFVISLGKKDVSYKYSVSGIPDSSSTIVNVYDSDNCLVYANVKHNSGTVTVYSNTKISGKICIVR